MQLTTNHRESEESFPADVSFQHRFRDEVRRADDTLESNSRSEKFTESLPVTLEGKRFASRSEAACAVLMEKYIPGFEIVAGETFQVEMGQSAQGNSRFVDFMVDGVLIEYHPPRFWRGRGNRGDFNGWQEYAEYRERHHELPKGPERKKHKQEMVQVLADRYYQKRRAIVDQVPEHRDRELIVAISEEDFYEQVIKRFGMEPLPNRSSFVGEFRALRYKSEHDNDPKKKIRRGRKRF